MTSIQGFAGLQVPGQETNLGAQGKMDSLGSRIAAASTFNPPDGDLGIKESPEDGSRVISDDRLSFGSLKYELEQGYKQGGNVPLKSVLFEYADGIDQNASLNLDTTTQPDTNGKIADKNDNSEKYPVAKVLKGLTKSGMADSNTVVALVSDNNTKPQVTPTALQAMVKASGFKGTVALQVGRNIVYVTAENITTVRDAQIRNTTTRSRPKMY